MPKIRTAFVMVLTFACLATPARAAIRTWTSSINTGNWDYTTSNWTGLTFSSGDQAQFFGGSGQSNKDITVQAGGVAVASVLFQGGYGTGYTFTGGDITGASATVTMNQDNTANFDRAGSYSFGGGTFMTASGGNVNYRPSVAGSLQFGSGNINLNNAGGNFRFQPTVVAATLTNNFVVGSSGAPWHPTTNGGLLSGSVSLGGSLALQPNSKLSNNVTMTGHRAITGSMYGGNHPIIDGNINGGGIYDLALTPTSAQDSYLYLQGTGGWNVRDIIKTGVSTAGILTVNANESTFFSGMSTNNGTFRIQQGNVQWQDATPNITFKMSLSPTAGFYATSPLTFTVDNGGLLGGSGTYASKSSTGVHTWTNAVTINVNNGGTIAPGDSSGIMTVTGSMAFGAGSALSMEVTGGGAVAGTDYDRLAVSGNITGLSNASLVVTFAPGVTFNSISGDVLTLITSANNLTGSAFTSVTYVNAPFFWADVTFGNGIVTLSNFNAVPEPSTFALLGIGVVGMAVRARRRRKAA